MATVLTVSHSLKRRSIHQNVGISQHTLTHIHLRITLLRLQSACCHKKEKPWQKSKYSISVSVGGNLCCVVVHKWKNAFFFDELISEPKQSQLTVFQTWPIDTFYFCYYISLRSLSIFNKQKAFFSDWRANPPLLELIQFLLKKENIAEWFRH